MVGILLSVCVAFLKSLGEFTGKVFTQSSNKNALDEYILAYGGRILGLVIILPVFFFVSVPLISLEMGGVLFASAFFNAITTVTALKAVKYGDLGLVSPLSALTLPFLLLTGYFIASELPNSLGFFGVFLIFIGTYFLQLHKLDEGLFGPIRAIFQDLGARYMLLTAILWSITTPLDKLGIEAYGVLPWMLYLNTLIVIIMAVYMSVYQRDKKLALLSNKKAFMKLSALTAVGALGLFLQMLALKYTLSIYVISIKRASGIFSVILGALFFREEKIFQKLIAASIMLTGVLCIVFYGNI